MSDMRTEDFLPHPLSHHVDSVDSHLLCILKRPAVNLIVLKLIGIWLKGEFRVETPPEGHCQSGWKESDILLLGQFRFCVIFFLACEATS